MRFTPGDATMRIIPPTHPPGLHSARHALDLSMTATSSLAEVGGAGREGRAFSAARWHRERRRQILAAHPEVVAAGRVADDYRVTHVSHDLADGVALAMVLNTVATVPLLPKMPMSIVWFC